MVGLLGSWVGGMGTDKMEKLSLYLAVEVTQSCVWLDASWVQSQDGTENMSVTSS